MRKLAGTLSKISDSDEINLTPMLDVVFIMLIFFVVTASFTKDAGITADRNEAQINSQPDAEAILVAVYADEIRINGRVIDIRAVRPNLEQLHAVNPEQAVVIQTAASSTTQTLVTVLDAARLADIQSVSVAPLDRDRTL